MLAKEKYLTLICETKDLVPSTVFHNLGFFTFKLLMLTNSNFIFKSMLLNTLGIKINVLFKTCFIYRRYRKIA